VTASGAPPAYETSRQVRVLAVLQSVLNLQPHVAIWVVYLTEFREISLAQVGIMEGAFWLVTLSFEIPSGAFADRFGRRIGFIAGVGVEGAGVLIFALADNFPLLMLSYALWASGIAFRSGNDGAFLYDALAAEGRTEEYADRYGAIQALMRFATSGGAIAGGVVAGVANLQFAAFSGFLVYLLAIPALFAMREPPRVSSSGVHSYLGTLGGAWTLLRRRPALRYVILFEVALMMAMPIQFLLFQPFLREHDIPLLLVGALIVPIELSAAAGSLLSGRASRAIGIPALGLVALGATIGGLLLLAALDHLVLLLAFALPQIARGVFAPAVSAYINQRATSDVRATVLSVGPFGHSLIFALVAPLAGVAGDASLRLAFAITAALILAAGGGFLALWWRADRVPPPPGAAAEGTPTIAEAR
jgi:MFS family permease